MKGILTSIVFLFFYSLVVNSQAIMQKQTKFDIEFYLISSKEKDSLMHRFNGSKDTITSEIDPGDFLYLLNDGRVIYEMPGIKSFLFTDFGDYKKYILGSVNLAESSKKNNTGINDGDFIEKVNVYVEKFMNEYSITSEINKTEIIRQIDVVLGSLSDFEIKRNRLSIIALIGELISQNLRFASWHYFNDPVNGKIPVILAEGLLIEPIKIFEKKLSELRKKGYPFNISGVVDEYIKYFEGK